MILGKIAEGLDNAEIARDLGLSIKTVRNHASNIFAKLHVAHRAQAIVLAREAGIESGEAALGAVGAVLVEAGVGADVVARSRWASSKSGTRWRHRAGSVASVPSTMHPDAFPGSTEVSALSRR